MTKNALKNKKQKGFTLVEMLVVIGIIAALAAVIIPNVSRFVGSGDAAAADTELQTVQAAMDLYIASPPNNGADVAPLDVANATNSFIAPTSPVLYPGFLRQAETKCDYYWTAQGEVSQVAGC